MYDAFISYRRADGARVARRLRRRLLEYELPKEVAEQIPPRQLSIYLDTIYERASEDFFARTIVPALDNSRRLIVVRTRSVSLPRPNGTKNWVVQEVEHFRRESNPNRNNVAIAVADGELADPLPADLDRDFPNVERVDVRRMGPFNIGARNEVLHLIAALYDVPDALMPLLRQEEAQRRTARLTAWLTGALLIVAALAVALSVALDSRREAASAAAEARRTLAASDFQQAAALTENTPLRMAHLARAVRNDPANDGARTMAIELLARRDWAVPTRELLGDQSVRANISRDGKAFVTWRARGEVIVYDTATLGERLRLQMRGHVFSADFHPNGQLLLVASDEDTGLWSLRTGRAVRKINTEVTVPGASFSADGAHYGTFDMFLRGAVHETASGRRVRFFPAAQGISFSRDGKWVMTIRGDDGKVAEASRLDGTGVPCPMTHADTIYSVQFNRDTTRAATASNDDTVALWDLATCRRVGEPLRHPADVREVIFDPRGGVATIAEDRAARLWRSDGTLIATLQHAGRVASLAFDPAGTRLVTASDDRTIRVWDAATGAAAGEPIVTANDATGAQFFPDGIHLLTTSVDGAVHIWDTRRGAAMPVVLPHEDSVSTARFAGNERLVTVTSAKVHQWNARTGKELRPPIDVPSTRLAFIDAERGVVATVDRQENAFVRRLADGTVAIGPVTHAATVNALLLTPQGRLVTGASDGLATVAHGSEARRAGRRGDAVYAVAVDPDERMLYAGTSDGRVYPFELQTGKLAAPPLHLAYSIQGIRFDAAGTEMTVVHGGAVSVFDAATRKLLRGGELRHDGQTAPTASDVSADSQTIVTYGSDMTVRIWDVATAVERARIVRSRDIGEARFFPGERRIAIRTDITRLHDITTGALLSEYQTPVGFGVAVGSDDGSRIAVGTNDIEVWDTLSGTAEGAERLASLLEAIGGVRLNASGIGTAAPGRAATIARLRQETAQASRGNTTDWFIRWFLADRAARTRSPLADVR